MLTEITGDILNVKEDSFKMTSVEAFIAKRKGLKT